MRASIIDLLIELLLQGLHQLVRTAELVAEHANHVEGDIRILAQHAKKHVAGDLHRAQLAPGDQRRHSRGVVEQAQFTDQLIGTHLVTPQTGEEGRLVQRVLVEQASNIDKEYYLGFVIDRASQRITVIASASGGMNIEEVARVTPEKVIRESVDPAVGMMDFQCRKIAANIGLRGKQIHEASRFMKDGGIM